MKERLSNVSQILQCVLFMLNLLSLHYSFPNTFLAAKTAQPQLWHTRWTEAPSPNSDLANCVQSARNSLPWMEWSHCPTWMTSPTVVGNFCSSRLYRLFHTVASSAANSCPLAFTFISKSLTNSLCERRIVSFYEKVRQKTKRNQSGRGAMKYQKGWCQNEPLKDTKHSITKVPKENSGEIKRGF